MAVLINSTIFLLRMIRRSSTDIYQISSMVTSILSAKMSRAITRNTTWKSLKIQISTAQILARPLNRTS
ncbi:hypothetical protein KCU74_g113, partial [Aureobasidium melanogenum]